MEITPQVIRSLNTGFNLTFQKAFTAATLQYPKIAMTVKSGTAKEVYAWLDMTPGMREWIGDRYINNVKSEGYTLVNKDYEETVAISANAIKDDNIGIYNNRIMQMGENAAIHPEQLVFSALKAGTTGICSDGLPFFSETHGNLDDGSSTPWYLMDVSRVVKPMILQEREPVKFTYLEDDRDYTNFMRNEYIFGSKARRAVGYGLWQLAYCSKEALTTANYNLARSAMMSLKASNGMPLSIIPNLLIVPPSLEESARKILNSEVIVENATLVSNVWRGTAELMVSPLLS